MTANHQCAQCGAPLTRVGENALCPGCTLEAGLDATREGEGTAVISPGATPRVSSDPGPGQPPAARWFGNYELLDEIARGGMGVVYRARQAGLDRLVAVKMLLSGPLASPDLVQRFRTEAAAAASLQHPNIVAIHEVGFSEGQHFIAMDYVPGRSLADLVRDGPVEMRRAARYVEIIARAIHFAHERKILHRDLKPSNVLVDASDTPRVTDFGLAKRLEADSELTMSGQVLGSPAYMPPEQVGAHRGRIGPQSDVYSLGAVLFHLLTGRPPFMADSVPAMLQQVVHGTPVSPQLLIAGLPADLETVCLKCLEKEPHRRYPSAQALADELRRFLDHEPILARPVTAPERVWRWGQRKPALALLIVLVHLVGIVGLAGIVSQWSRAERSAIAARTQRDLAEGRLYAAEMREAHAEYLKGNTGGALALLRSWLPTPERSDWRGFEWYWLSHHCESQQGELLATNVSSFSAISASLDGQCVALGTADGTIQLIDTRNGSSSELWRAHPGPIDSLAFLGVGARWLATVGGDDGLLKIWDTQQAREVVATNCAKGSYVRLAVSRSGRWLAVRAPIGHRLNIWEWTPPTNGRPLLTLKQSVDGLGPAAFGPDETSLAVANHHGHGNLTVYDLARGQQEPLNPGHANFVEAIAFSNDGAWLATGGADEHVVIWNVPRRIREHSLRGLDNFNVTALTFSTDSRALFAATSGQNIHCWQMADPLSPRMLRGHATGLNALAIGGSEGATLFSAGHDRTARRWEVDLDAFLAPEILPAAAQDLEVSPGPALGLAVSPDQRRLAVSHHGRLSLIDLDRRSPIQHLDSASAFEPHPNGVHALAYSPDGVHLCLGGSEGWLGLLNASTLQSVRRPLKAHDDEITHLAFAGGGRVVVSVGRFGGGVQLTDVETWTCLGRLDAAGHHPRPAFAVNAHGTRLVTSGPNLTIGLWDIESAPAIKRLAQFSQPVRFLTAAAFAPEDQWIALGDDQGTIYLWDPTGREAFRRLEGHQTIIMSLQFSPDGRTLASGGADHTVRLWHPNIDQQVAVLEDHRHWVFQVAFAAHGKALISTDHSGTVKLWPTAP